VPTPPHHRKKGGGKRGGGIYLREGKLFISYQRGVAKLTLSKRSHRKEKGPPFPREGEKAETIIFHWGERRKGEYRKGRGENSYFSSHTFSKKKRGTTHTFPQEKRGRIEKKKKGKTTPSPFIKKKKKEKNATKK